MLYFTSDHHFGHTKIIDYANRPFTDLDRMHGQLVRQWNIRVEPDDDVWYLGDVALGRLDESLKMISRLNGHKVLLPGNHDRCWQGHKKAERERQRYLDAGFEAILDDPQMLTIAGQDVLISHFPYAGTGDHEGIEERYLEHKPVDEGGWLLHGHVHQMWRISGRQINVGVDAWGGTPLALASVEYYLTHPFPHDREPFPWSWAANMTEEELEASPVMQAVRRSMARTDKWGRPHTEQSLNDPWPDS